MSNIKSYRQDASGQKLVTVIPGDGIGPGSHPRHPARHPCRHRRQDRLGDVRSRRAGLCAACLRRAQETIASIHRSRVVLKGPLSTPAGKAKKSANVTLRKVFETYGEHKARAHAGFRCPDRIKAATSIWSWCAKTSKTCTPGIEHMQTANVAQCLADLATGLRKVARLAFAVARAEGRKRVHRVTKANIMKLTEDCFSASSMTWRVTTQTSPRRTSWSTTPLN